MTVVTQSGPSRTARGTGVILSAVLELSVLVTLLVFLGIATGKLFVVLERVGIPFWNGAPLGVLFLLAAVFAARRISARVRGLRRSEVDGSS